MTSAQTDRAAVPWAHTDEADCQHASRILEIVGQRWSPSILLALARGAQRFTEITTVVAGLSSRMLTLRLKQLESARLVERTVIPTTPVSVRYRLTPQGLDLITALQPIAGFVQRWEPRDRS
ncbi:helix-turn-helix transcriptional regulator [Aeromicrobium sp. YIM 150415]|uniref:winged helix-turn-helix transcriptional regulator n=1 Tax=Aeromicrobium sp. YIM 150415 TaxID=2803912 RepID=UPI001964EA0B|nr:helix-turn-helix domain-containing protein [Aeromicrobium sp. YIM 150415]MBM9464388.1 helix-turn-helix transcriptional regulator [Aeromicrobium sp. YIM 150415]